MKLLKRCFHIILPFVLIVLTPKGIRAGIWDSLSPSIWIQKLTNVKAPVTQPPVKTTPVPTKIVNPQETIFNLAPRLQSYFGPGDLEAKENFIFSPLSAIVILAQILIGVHGWHNGMIENVLDLSEDADKRLKREITIIKETKDELYDYEFHHGAFHYRLWSLVRNALSNQGQDKAILSYVLFHQEGIQFVEHFRNNMNRVYKPDLDIIPIDFGGISSSTDVINQWGAKHNDEDLASRLTELIQPNSQSILLHKFVLECTWKTPLKKAVKKKEDFHVTPYQTVKVKYLKGTIPNTIYVDFEDFTMVSIPLNYADTNVYILLPQGSDFTKYNIRRFSEGLKADYFQGAIENHKVLRDVNLKVPDVFSQFISFDVMKPLLMYINEANERMGTSDDTYLKLNAAAKNLKINNLMQHVHLTIHNKSLEEFSEKNETSQPDHTLGSMMPQFDASFTPQPPPEVSTHRLYTPMVTQASFISTVRPTQQYSTSPTTIFKPTDLIQSAHPATNNYWSAFGATTTNPTYGFGVTSIPAEYSTINAEQNKASKYPIKQTVVESTGNSDQHSIAEYNPIKNVTTVDPYQHSIIKNPAYGNGANTGPVYNPSMNKIVHDLENMDPHQHGVLINPEHGLEGINTFPKDEKNTNPLQYSKVNNPALGDVINTSPNKNDEGMGKEDPYQYTGPIQNDANKDVGNTNFFQYPKVNNPAYGNVANTGPVYDPNNNKVALNDLENVGPYQYGVLNNPEYGLGGTDTFPIHHNAVKDVINTNIFQYSKVNNPAVGDVIDTSPNKKKNVFDDLGKEDHYQYVVLNKPEYGLGGTDPIQNDADKYPKFKSPAYGNVANTGPVYKPDNNKASLNDWGNAGPYQYAVLNNPGYGGADSSVRNSAAVSDMGNPLEYSKINSPASNNMGRRFPSGYSVMNNPGFDSGNNGFPSYYPVTDNKKPSYYQVESNFATMPPYFINRANNDMSKRGPPRHPQTNNNHSLINHTNLANLDMSHKGPHYPRPNNNSSLINQANKGPPSYPWTNNNNQRFDNLKNARPFHYSGTNNNTGTNAANQNKSTSYNQAYHRRAKKESVVDFEVTRPFVYIIMKPSTKVVLVWGSVAHPEKLQQ